MNPDFIARLQATVEEQQARLVGAELRFLCPDPEHDDHDPSASWHPENHVWYCHACGAGGGAYDLAKLLGVELPPSTAKLTLDELAEYVGLPSEFLREVGCSDGVSGVHRETCVVIPYTDRHGEVTATRKRLRIKGEPRFLWQKGSATSPYGLARLGDARKQGRLLIVEGESDSWVCWFNNFPALGLPGASTWKAAWNPYIEGIERVFIWREPDQGGDTMATKMLANLSDAYIVDAPPGIKDIGALWHASAHDKELFLLRVNALLDAGRPASTIRAEALTEDARELEERTRQLAYDPNLIVRIARAIREAGYVGSAMPPMLAYIAGTSRLLRRPLNLALVGPSASGKSVAVEAGLSLLPEEAYHVEKAGSARALIYTDESFEHRMVVVWEMDSIPQEDGSAASAIRSLAEDGFMTYDVVEKDPESGEFRTRRITKQGPTGLITTGVKNLREQMSTRMLTISIKDTPDQTRAVLLAHAAAVAEGRESPDVSALVDFQRWLALAGDHDVVVPFARQLAEFVPAEHIRMRRDFKQLLTVIQAVALLYQRQRERDAKGRIVATLDDYEHARALVEETFGAAASGGVTKGVRETVEALAAVLAENQKELSATNKQLADKLGLTVAGVWHRVQRAIFLGYIVNQETKPRQPAKLVLGDPLPEDVPALPTVEQLRDSMRDTSSAPPENHLNVKTDRDSEAAASDSEAMEPEAEDADAINPAFNPAFNPTFNQPDEGAVDSSTEVEDGSINRLNDKPGEDGTYVSMSVTPGYGFCIVCRTAPAIGEDGACEGCHDRLKEEVVIDGD